MAGKYKRDEKGRWMKGNIPLNKNKKTPIEYIKKAVETRKKNESYKVKEETKQKISLANKGKKKKPFTKMHLLKLSISHKGQHNSPKTEFKKGNPAPRTAFKKGNIPHNFNNYSSFEPYGKEFNKQLKEQIRQRDNYRCQECFRHQDELFRKVKGGKISKEKLAIHHIDYNKKNNDPVNLISLCRNCHSQTNFNRDNWIDYYKGKVK